MAQWFKADMQSLLELSGSTAVLYQFQSFFGLRSILQKTETMVKNQLSFVPQ
jgi:hypothetical protein